MIVEWNTHIFSPDAGKYPLHENAAYRPDMSRHPADPLAAYLERMKEEGIGRAVIVHPEPYGDDHRLVLECLHHSSPKTRSKSFDDSLVGSSIFRKTSSH